MIFKGKFNSEKSFDISILIGLKNNSSKKRHSTGERDAKSFLQVKS